jgi:5'-deoxynucleotidase YfbR-like HD superfamily hydrolase
MASEMNSEIDSETTSETISKTASEMPSEMASKVALETSRRTIAAAFSSFKESISLEDALAFQETSLEDVLKSLEEIQLAQRERKSLRNVGRVGPFLKSLESYSKVIEVLCNGTPYLPWLWVVVSTSFK